MLFVYLRLQRGYITALEHPSPLQAVNVSTSRIPVHIFRYAIWERHSHSPNTVTAVSELVLRVS